jgi:acetyltransferase-like isoleucine patch superfamily enzyme
LRYFDSLAARYETLTRLFAIVVRGHRPTSFEMAVANGMRVGKDVQVDAAAIFDVSHAWLIELEDGARVAPFAYILAHDGSMKVDIGYTRIGRVTIGRSAFIGAYAVVLPNVTIGAGSIVGAGCVVSRDVEPGIIVAGNPARQVGRIDEYLRRQADDLERLPRFPAEGYTLSGGMTDATRDEMRAALEHSAGFVE